MEWAVTVEKIYQALPLEYTALAPLHKPARSNSSKYTTVFVLSFLPCYLLTYSVIQNADAVLTSRDKMTSAIVERVVGKVACLLDD